MKSYISKNIPSLKALAHVLLLLGGCLVIDACIPKTKTGTPPTSPIPSNKPTSTPVTIPTSNADPGTPKRKDNEYSGLIAGVVVGIKDGDTITVLDQNKVQHQIRLSGIDAPETCQDFGRVAKKRMSDMVFGKQVKVLHYNKYHRERIIGKVVVDDVDANLQLVIDGFALHYKEFEREQSEDDRALYANAEQKARDEKIGLWSQPNMIPPWDFRRMKKCGRSE